MFQLVSVQLTYFLKNYTRTISVFGLILLLILSFVKFLKFQRLVKTIDLIPGPKCSPIIGKILGNFELIWAQIDKTDIIGSTFKIMWGLTMIYQSIDVGLCRIWLGPFQSAVLLFRADLVEPLLSSTAHIEKSREYSFFEPWLGRGLLTSSGDHWRSHRKLLTPSFHFKILENFVPIINGQQKTMVNIIESKIKENNGIIDDIRPLITNCALDIICETAMGVTVNAQTDLESNYVKSLKSILTLFIDRFIQPWIWNPIIYGLSSSGKQFKENASVLHKFSESVIKERKNEILKKMEENKDNNIEKTLTDIGRKSRLAFLDALLIQHIQSPEVLSERDIREEVDTFMFEGHDTTSVALMFALQLIGEHPEVQTKIHNELDYIFGTDIEREINMEDLRKMRYLEQCIKEVLRIGPSVPYIARNNNEPFFVGEYEIPKNTTCLIIIAILHRDPHYFPNPEVFDPDRFSVEASAERHPYAYVPFSAGPRNCIGQKFALLEEKALLSYILRRYRITSLTHRTDVLLDYSVILKPISELRIKFENRFVKSCIK